MELERLGKYELLERLGQGGMGEVWKARDTQLRRYIAIKLLHTDLQANPDFVTHFMREAQFVASLHHPNIVQVHDFQIISTVGSSVKAYMVMEYIEGGTLADYIRDTVRRGLFPPAADIVSFFTAIGLALDYAHRKGMIHRDIKPANILLDKSANTGKAMGEPILTDFGIARLQGTSASTVTRALIGTPRYISPEQAEGRTIDERSDLYALGIVLYEMVTGVTPFRGDNPIAIMMQHVHERPTPPSLINPNVSPAISAIVLQSISKDPQARFPSATAMTVALAEAFNLPVPAILNKPKNMNEGSIDNPLQPLRQMPVTTFPPPLAASPSTPASAVYREPQFIPPVPLTPAINNRNRNEPHAETRAPESVSADAADLYSSRGVRASSSPPMPSPPTRLRHRSLLIALIGILLLVGIGAFYAFPLISSKNAATIPNSSSAIVGRILFVSSRNASHHTFDQLQIDLENVPLPPSGKVYYGWLENVMSETTEYQHWEIQFSNGSVHSLYESNPKNTDLFTHSTLFLITEEAVGSIPVVPIPDLSLHIYYAVISHISSSPPAFEVKHCPPSSPGNAGNPCI